MAGSVPPILSHCAGHPDVTGKQVIAKLKAAGGSLDRIHGSHHIMTKSGLAVPIPGHGSRDLGAGLLAALRRQTGVELK